MAWKKGPLPKDTYGWGGVVSNKEFGKGEFLFADFRGDKVYILATDSTLGSNEVLLYDNDLTLPPK